MELSLPSTIKDASSAFLNLVFPLYCQICKRPLDFRNRRFLCDACWIAIPKISKDITFESEIENCFFDDAWSVCWYDGVIKECIHLFKYNKKIFLGAPFRELMIDFIKGQIPIDEFGLIVGVPLHYTRKKERGFNQAQILALAISKHFNIPISKNNLIRTRPTPSQIELDKQQRLSNVKGAFIVKKKDEFKDKKILLIDDVFTTGSTLNECSKALKKAGAASISIFTLARGI